MEQVNIQTMRRLTIIVLTLAAVVAYGQDKYNYVHFNKLTEVQGTAYVIASIENLGKMVDTKGKYLLFIDTKTGQSNQIDFPSDGYIEKIEQVKIDTLGINKIIVFARTVDLNNKNGVDWVDPKQIIILSTDGKEKIQLTDSKLFVRTWTVNRQSGVVVVTGHYDSNNNNKYDKVDKNEILIYDLKNLRLVKKI
jgi:hypothetical protein